MSVNREGPVPAERLEALAKECVSHARRIRALLAEAREEGKPLPEISEAQLYEAVRHKSIKDRMDAVSALFARVAPPASAGTEGLREALDYNTQEQDGYIYHGASSHAKIHSDDCPRCKAIAALRGEGEPPDPDLNADGPAERAHRQDEARRSK